MRTPLIAILITAVLWAMPAAAQDVPLTPGVSESQRYLQGVLARAFIVDHECSATRLDRIAASQFVDGTGFYKPGWFDTFALVFSVGDRQFQMATKDMLPHMLSMLLEIQLDWTRYQADKLGCEREIAETEEAFADFAANLEGAPELELVRFIPRKFEYDDQLGELFGYIDYARQICLPLIVDFTSVGFYLNHDIRPNSRDAQTGYMLARTSNPALTCATAIASVNYHPAALGFQILKAPENVDVPTYAEWTAAPLPAVIEARPAPIVAPNPTRVAQKPEISSPAPAEVVISSATPAAMETPPAPDTQSIPAVAEKEPETAAAPIETSLASQPERSCWFMLERINRQTSVRERIGGGTFEVADGALAGIKGHWTTGGRADPDTYRMAAIKIGADGKISGTMEINYLFETSGQPSHRPVEVTMTSDIDFERQPAAEVRFDIDPQFEGILTVDGCRAP